MTDDRSSDEHIGRATTRQRNSHTGTLTDLETDKTWRTNFTSRETDILPQRQTGGQRGSLRA